MYVIVEQKGDIQLLGKALILIEGLTVTSNHWENHISLRIHLERTEY